MKKLYSFLTLLFLSATVWAQIPQKMSYQAVVRDEGNSLVINRPVGVKMSIVQGSGNGNTVYSELFNPNPETNTNGLLTFEIGGGTPVSGTFSEIDWSKGPFFIRTEIDPSGGSNYAVTGTSPLLSVPFALHAHSVENDKVDDADNNPTNEIQQLNLSGTTLSLSKGGGSVNLPTSGGGGSDNWGTQSVISDATLDGTGTSASPLKLADNAVTSVKIADGAVTGSKIENGAVTGTKIAQLGASSGQVLKWDGSTWTAADDIEGSGNDTWQSSGNNIYRSTGNVGVGITNPTALLHTYGTGAGEGNVLFRGFYKNSNPGNPPQSGPGTRMMWYPDQAAFRVGFIDGSIDGSVWDFVHIGSFSVAMGYTTKASSIAATALGFQTTASGRSSFAVGEKSIASGRTSIALGNDNIASNNSAVAIGVYNVASGIASLATNINTQAKAYASVAMGQFNVGSGTANSWVSTDPLFEIGNGSSNNNRANAFTVLKNGKVGLGTESPVTTVHVRHGVLATNAPAPVEGIRIHNSGANNNSWTLYTVNSNGNLQFYANNELRGTFSATSGTYTSSSNRRLKTNITALGEDILKRTLKLEPVSYRFISNPQSEPTIGFIAEDVQPLFPELVEVTGENGENLGVNYAAFSVVAIKAIQQQQKQMEALQNENKQLKKQMNVLNAENEHVKKRMEQLEAFMVSAMNQNK